MKDHNIGDLVLFALNPYHEKYEFGIITGISPQAYMPYHIKWFNLEIHGDFSEKQVRRFKMNFNKLKNKK